MFAQFKKAMQENFNSLLAQSQQLYLTNVDKDLLWAMYLESFPESERQEHNCNACKSFIRHYGGLVAIINYEMVSIWKFDCEKPFTKVVKNLDKLVSNGTITDMFFTTEVGLGTNQNRQLLEDKTTIRTWEHMFFQLPKERVIRSADSIESLMGKARDIRNVFKRSLDEITVNAVEMVLDLITQNSLYRGAESKDVLEEFLRLKKIYEKVATVQKDNYCWTHASRYTGSIAKIRNTAIGTLLTNLSEDMDLDQAVTAFESIMAPSNYKRPTALVTQKMIDEAEKTIEQLGYANSLGRRFATVDDLTVNNLLFVNRDTKKAMGALRELKETVPVNTKAFGKVEEISIGTFVDTILPKCTRVEVLFENRHISNLVSLITAEDPKAPSLFKWNNPFSWSYKGSLTDSIKEKVKSAGGSVEGELRASLEWYNFDDLDLHVIEPGRNSIYYGHKVSEFTGGNLDVDMNAGGGRTRTPVENIIWPSQAKMKEGRYKVYVHQFSRRETIDIGFTAQIECQGQLLTFSYDKPMGTSKIVEVATFDYTKTGGITIINSLDHSGKVTSQKVWNVDTNKFHKASMILQSPNYWDGGKVGNAHLIFVLDQAHNDEQARGFFNEFLKEELVVHKRVFEALGSRMKVAPADKQITGLGFSVTQHHDLICTVEGTFNRTLKLKF